MYFRKLNKGKEHCIQNRLTEVARSALGSLPLPTCSVNFCLHDLDFENVCVA